MKLNTNQNPTQSNLTLSTQSKNITKKSDTNTVIKPTVTEPAPTKNSDKTMIKPAVTEPIQQVPKTKQRKLMQRM